MAVADSSFIVALLYPADVNHEKAVEIFNSLNRLDILDWAVGESATVLSYKLNKEDFVSIWRAFSPFLNTYNLSLRDALNFYSQLPPAPKVSFIDSAVIQLALSLQAPLLTFDKNQQKLWERLRIR
ncbi:MAG: PIN domain-containing protein [Candidatus Micrarchaeota archaeon]|nr:PIN domain-containing protein [Candidatus Micrarchaeota archaeon]